MLEEYKGIIDINKLLKDKFDYQFDGNLLDLYDKPFIEMEGNGVDAMFWINIDNERYLFKPLKDAKYNAWGELLSSKLSEYLSIPCAKYRYAKFGNLEGVITKSFIKEDETLILGSEVMQKFFNKKKKKSNIYLSYEEEFNELYNIPENIKKLNSHERGKKIFKYINNLEDIWSIIYEVIDEKKDVKEIVKHLLKMLMFDIITLQYDRHPNNWGIVQFKKNYHISNLFDNSTSFGLGRLYMEDQIVKFKYAFLNRKYDKGKELDKIIYDPNLKFSLTSDDFKENLTSIEVFEKLLKNSSSDNISSLVSIIDLVDEDLIDKIILEVENENGIKMDDDLYFYIFNIMSINIQNIQNLVKEYRDDLYARKTK